ncbi:MAG TPA: hypothetical protein PK503_05120 [Azonexus sp.]|nr:hypothetical protein [Azonexus sp.]
MDSNYLKRELTEADPAIGIITNPVVREAAFPWQEAGVVPSRETLAAVLESPSVARRLQELGVRFVIFTLVDHDEWFGGPLICQAGRMGIAVGKEVTTSLHFRVESAGRKEQGWRVKRACVFSMAAL